jgi:hypothetical protein
MTRIYQFPSTGDAGEPERDERLGALLRDVVGDAPAGDVDWSALANRVGAAVRAHHAAPWWSYAERWQRRALPLALAAGLVGSVALWRSAGGASEAAALSGSPDLVTAVVSGTSSADAAQFYAGSVTSTADFTAGVPE